MRRLLTRLALLFTVAIAATACGSGNPTTNAGGVDELGPGPSGGATPSSSVSPTGATPSPGPTPAPGGGLGPVTHGAIPNMSGYVWASMATTASYPAVDAYHFNSTGGAVTVARSSTGRYTVTFAGLGGPGGVAHASAYGSNSNFCNVVSWVSTGADEKVSVACFSASTAPVDSTFVANFAMGHQAGAQLSYLWNDQASATGQHVPSVAYRYDSTGRDPWINRISAGRYQVYLPASYDQQSEPYTFQVTAYGAATFRCQLASAFIGAGIHEIQCRDATGALFDSQFALTYSAVGSIIGRTDLRYGSYNDASPGVSSLGTGVYTVSAADLGAARGQVVVDARGNTSNYCHVGGWAPSGTALSMTVRCFAPGGAPANSGFTLGVTW